MKILHLAFQNLNSLKGRFDIDFSEGPLSEAGIFAITGPTGSGKTTILDAITLALFGKAARYDDNKRNNPENMMSRGTGECFAEVSFECGKGVYSARWDLARARKKPDGRIQGTKRQLADASGDVLETKIRLVDEAVTELTGLDYHRFLRSVLLAQGRFKEFLDAGIKDRGELLERITGTEIYSELSILAHEAAREKEEAIKDARTAANLISLLSEEDLKGLDEEHGSLAELKQALEDKLKTLIGRLDCHAAWVKATTEKENLQIEQKAWHEQNTGFQPQREKLKRHQAAAPLAGDLKLWASKNNTLTTLKGQLAELKTAHTNARNDAATAFASAVAACTNQIQAIETRRGKGLAQKEALTLDITAMEAWQRAHSSDESIENALAKLRGNAETIRSMAQGLMEADKAAALTLQSMDRLQKERKTANTEEAQSKKELADKEGIAKNLAAELSALKPKAEWTRQKEAAEKMRGALEDLTRLMDAHLTVCAEQETLKAQRSEQEAEKKRLDAEAAKLCKSLETERRILSHKEVLHTQASVIASLEERRAQLVPGEACPLCGATAHPFADHDLPKPSDTEAALKTQKTTVADLEKKERHCEKSLTATLATLKGLDAQLTAQEKKASEISKNVSRISSEQAIDMAIGDRPKLDALISENRETLDAIGRQLSSIETLETKLTAAEKACIAARGRSEASAARLVQLNASLADTTARLEEQRAHQARLKEDTHQALTAFEQSLAPWNLTATSPEEASKALAALETRAAAWRSKGDALKTARHTLTTTEAGLATLADQITRIKTERNEWTEKSAPFSDIEVASPEVPDALLADPARRTLCEKALSALAALATRIATTERELADGETSRKAFHVELTANAIKRGFADITELTSALLDEDTLAGLQAESQRLETQKVRLETLTRQTEEALARLAEKKPPTDEEAAELTRLKQEKEKERDNLLKRMGEISAALAADKKARADQADQLKQIDALEAEARPWLVLKDLIGSSNGSKFSTFAQGLTLAQLVSLANRHLVTLNPRYEIQRIPGEDLELEIIDRYQADAVRPTKSLSGGESFLVSLALALGLSEMAGRKTRIESLFIDEGFGSLDSDTLDTALAALENLRLSSRTIGVISHVELLKNRLGTQIEVTRTADGHATLAIVDG
ncbi:AAA family ATPase [Desulfoluna butyratoxydans]|uniref:Putative exonuclease sbccd c subunit n=1 Tax=Desulfoluna butyratoxydans TaxID=231438 RepID=A0A4U8YK79_9BACT|nr:AAA family ATPase [Desulfoluna butyratoxydans]VFQ43890.1 putative exonuclease sbccd c subunit [Desulfoluna butyratoxydans]